MRERYEAWLATLSSQPAREGWLGQVATTFLKVSANYRDGLFHCYDVPDLPATNNELERRFGTLRYHERRASGRRAVSGGLVVRGAVRVVAVLSAERLEEAAANLRLSDETAWRTLRHHLEARAESRRAQRRFRHDPAAYLAKLEQHLLKSSLPTWQELRWQTLLEHLLFEVREVRLGIPPKAVSGAPSFMAGVEGSAEPTPLVDIRRLQVARYP